ncbi:thiamine diphosphokinase [Lederbergia wuyishanensis]|uniref:Thiamine diphosphokinase n=1 Tax=Lederbergia wuyishanensis TaxID=1347903 RepID=A0ABU0CZM7_9BACI|nr:thiamine diphosphokinase [Lederbergia wuyishanensis]MCJ8006221.1 thiamine diphosphokinase [Lederbergia wuyishanensis]MDQ0341591.1 thiamine pyrophosphokinase [Lederbergia wuyishanensis]
MSEQKKIIHIVAGGPLDMIPELTHYPRDIVWIGVDRGVYYLLENGIKPDYSVGDFDSVSDEEWSFIEHNIQGFKKVLPEKDETDMELALMWAVQEEPEQIKIFGATGGRLDHFMANALMLSQFQNPNIKIEMIDKQNSLSLYYPGHYRVERDSEKKYISFIPLTKEIIDLSLTGFKYPLINRTVEFGSSLCISNELIKQSGNFSFKKGILLMIRSTD